MINKVNEQEGMVEVKSMVRDCKGRLVYMPNLAEACEEVVLSILNNTDSGYSKGVTYSNLNAYVLGKIGSAYAKLNFNRIFSTLAYDLADIEEFDRDLQYMSNYKFMRKLIDDLSPVELLHVSVDKDMRNHYIKMADTNMLIKAIAELKYDYKAVMAHIWCRYFSGAKLIYLGENKYQLSFADGRVIDILLPEDVYYRFLLFIPSQPISTYRYYNVNTYILQIISRYITTECLGDVYVK